MLSSGTFSAKRVYLSLVLSYLVIEVVEKIERLLSCRKKNRGQDRFARCAKFIEISCKVAGLGNDFIEKLRRNCFILISEIIQTIRVI